MMGARSRAGRLVIAGIVVLTVSLPGLSRVSPAAFAEQAGTRSMLLSPQCKAARKNDPEVDVPIFYVTEIAVPGVDVIPTPQIAYNDAAAISGKDYSTLFVTSPDKPPAVRAILAKLHTGTKPPTKAYTVNLQGLVAGDRWKQLGGPLEYVPYGHKAPWLLHWLKCYPGRTSTKAAQRVGAGCIPPNIFLEPDLELDKPSKWEDRASCDEYPFASTKEGGSGSLIRPVPEEENTSQGQNLGTFLTLNIVTLAHNKGLFQVCVILAAQGKIGDGCTRRTYTQLQQMNLDE
jgi:hypothetical protein